MVRRRLRCIKLYMGQSSVLKRFAEYIYIFIYIHMLDARGASKKHSNLYGGALDWYLSIFPCDLFYL